MSTKNQPYLHLYVQDFLTDVELAECSASSCGVYIRIMLLMTKAPTFGKLLLKQKYKQIPKQTPSTDASKIQVPDKNLLTTCYRFALQLAKHLPYDIEVIETALIELISETVLRIDGDYLYQKRMVKDGEISHKRSLAGKKGGKQRVKNQASKSNEFASDFAQAKGEAKLKQNHDSDNDNTLHTAGGMQGGKIREELQHIPEPIERVYNLSFEGLQKLDGKMSEGVTAEDFEEWKDFVDLMDKDEHEFYKEVFNCKFVFPKAFTDLKNKKGFKREHWEMVTEKMISVGLEPRHNLQFRIPDAMKWLKIGTAQKHSTDHAVKNSGSGKNYSKNKFK